MALWPPSRAAPVALQPPPTLYVTGVYPRGGRPPAERPSSAAPSLVRLPPAPPADAAFFANGTATCVAPPSNATGDATLTLNDRTTPSLDRSAAPAALLGGRLAFGTTRLSSASSR